jgi:hypothetical protein
MPALANSSTNMTSKTSPTKYKELTRKAVIDLRLIWLFPGLPPDAFVLMYAVYALYELSKKHQILL